jgi:hypothetical protein
MTVSIRSRILLFGSTLAPITIVGLRFASALQYRAVASALRPLFGYATGLLPDISLLLGMACFAGFLGSLLVDYFRSRGAASPK